MVDGADGVDDLGVEGVGDIEDSLFMNIGQDTVVLVWWVCFPERYPSAQHPHIQSITHIYSYPSNKPPRSVLMDRIYKP